MRELLSYNADILCLQEARTRCTRDAVAVTTDLHVIAVSLHSCSLARQIQDDHFQDYFAPTLQKHGYTAVYKKKTAQASPFKLSRLSSPAARLFSVPDRIFAHQMRPLPAA